MTEPLGQAQIGQRIGHPAIERTLALFTEHSPRAAERARSALDLLLGWTTRSAWQEVIWQFSRLTGDGFPVEIAFSSTDPALRYTVEIAGPEVQERERLDLALQLLDRLGAPAIEPGLGSIFERLQSESALTYGVWIGGRHRAESENYKLYLEARTSRSAVFGECFNELLAPDLLTVMPRVKLLMIGFEPDSHRAELYFEAIDSEVWQFERLLHHVGLFETRNDLWDLIGEAQGQSIGDRMPGGNVGFSLALDRGRQVTALTIFNYAAGIFGCDRRTRDRILAVSDSRGWDFRLYEAFSRPLRERSNCHLCVGFTAAQHGELSLQIGLRPP